MHHDTDCQNLLHVAVIGHSFITRLHRYIRLNPRLGNFNLDVNSFVFDFQARGGLRIPHLVNSRDFFILWHPPWFTLHSCRRKLHSKSWWTVYCDKHSFLCVIFAWRQWNFTCDYWSTFPTSAMGLINWIQPTDCTG